MYINGVLHDTKAGSATGSNDAYINKTMAPYVINSTVWNAELFEIYNYAWSASQVANDYNSSTFKDIRNWLILDVDSRQGVIEDKMAGTITNINWVAIKKNKNNDMYFNWTNSYLICPELKPVYLSFWWRVFNKWVGSTALWSVIISLIGAYPQVIPYSFVVDYANARAWLYINSNTLVSFTPNWSMKNNQRQHVFAKYDGAYKYIYINWVLANQTARTSNPNYTTWTWTTKVWFLVSWFYRVPLWFMNMVRMYNRALSENEISQLYTSQLPFFN